MIDRSNTAMCYRIPMVDYLFWLQTLMTSLPEPTNSKQPQLPVAIMSNGRKPRLSSQFTWPIGVQRLSERFAHVPQYAQLSVWFNDRPMEHQYRIDQIAKLEIDYQILTIWYSTIGEPHWYFMVYPIRRDLRATGRKAIEDTAFPAMDTWLCESRTQTWLADSQHFRCNFNPKDGKITTIEESSF